MPFDHGLPGTPSTHNADDYPTVAAVKGLKIRVQQSDLWVALITALGANATPMPRQCHADTLRRSACSPVS